MSTTTQQDPVTLYVRPVAAVMEQLRSLCEGAGVPAEIYEGTTAEGLAERIPYALQRTGGDPVAIVCYAGSTFANSPRRTAVFYVMVLSADTRPSAGTPGAIEAAWLVQSAVDRLVTQETDGGYPVTDIFKVTAETAVDIPDAGAACAVQLEITQEDY